MNDPALLQQVKQMLVRQLKLPQGVDGLADDEILFGGNLDLDSIDVLEIVVGLEKDFGIRIADRALGERVIKTPRSIAEYVAEQNADSAGA
jgi:acyl carrier protein